MKIVNKYLWIMIMAMFALFAFYNEKVSAEINNFVSDSDSVIVETSDKFPFEDAVFGEDDVIKSTNEGVIESSSTLTIKFNEIGEIRFYYLISSESSWDFLRIYANDTLVLETSGEGEWQEFAWYSENVENNTIVVKYEKDISIDEGNDCVYLKSLVFDTSLYSPLLNVLIDGSKVNMNDVVYYDYVTGNNVLSFSLTTIEYSLSDYSISVKLNGEDVAINEYSVALNGSEFWKLNNLVEISYYITNEEYKARSLSFTYNASLSEAAGGLEFVNDEENLFVIKDYNGEKVISSTNVEKGSISYFIVLLDGSGVLTFDYLVSGIENFDFLNVSVDGKIILEASGEFSSFKSFSYVIYGERDHDVVFSYSKSDSSYSFGDNCVYIKNVSYENVNYVDIPDLFLNGEEVYNGEGYIIENVEENKLTFGEYDSSVINVVVALNGNVLTYDLEKKAYLLEDLLDENVINVTFTSYNLVSREIKFYFYKEEIDKVFNLFENDLRHGLVRSTFEGDMVVKTTIEGMSDYSSTIFYVASNSGVLTVEYFAYTDLFDYFIIKVNDVEIFKDSNNREWQSYRLTVDANDIIELIYETDEEYDTREGVVYFKNISFEEKLVTEIIGGSIGDLPFDSSTKELYFDWNNPEVLLSFNELKTAQTVEVSINGIKVDETSEGQYDLSSNLKYVNVISIIYKETGYEPRTLVINYRAKLIENDNIEYTASSVYVLVDFDSSRVIGVNPNLKNIDRETIQFKVTGKGYFNFSVNYFTYDNLITNIYFDSGLVYEVNYDFESGKWINAHYQFFKEGEHIIEIVVDSTYFYNDIDYIYFKDFSFVPESEIIGLLEGTGAETKPYDYSNIIGKLEEVNAEKFEYSFYNNELLNSIYVNKIEGYSINVNGRDITQIGVNNLTLYSQGKSIVQISNGELAIIFYFYNEGIYDSSISAGYGTLDNPYLVSTEEQLKDIAKGLEYCFALENNISLTSNWISLGSAGTPFTGCLDGKGNTISNLTISQGNISGLFAYANGALISNLNLDNVSITSGTYVGALVGYGNNLAIENVNIINVDILLSNTEEHIIYAGGIIGATYESDFDGVEVSGTIRVSSTYESSVGGFSGRGGNFKNSNSNVDVEGNCYVGAVVGVAEGSIIENTSIRGNVQLSNTTSAENIFGLITSSSNFYLNNVTHYISGSYTSQEETIISAYLYGIGIGKEGLLVDLDNGLFSAKVVLTNEGDQYFNGLNASFNGYVIRFVLENDEYRYYELFDFVTNVIRSHDIVIDIDSLSGYSSDLSSFEVDNTSSLYSEDKYEEITTYSSYLNVYISDIEELEHIEYIINYGIPVSFGTYNVHGEYNLTMNLIINNNLDLSTSSFKGLANSLLYPYMGNIDGKGSTITLAINNSKAFIGGFVKYYSSKGNDVEVKNLVLEGSINSSYAAGFIGAYVGGDMLTISNIVNYMSVSANYKGSLLGIGFGPSVTLANCINYASFDSSIFVGNGVRSIYYAGENKNYGCASNNDNKTISEIFFGTSDAIKVDDNSTLINYYKLNVNVSNISISINGKKYTSDNGIILFEMDNEDLYSALIASDLLVEKKYTLSSTFASDFILPKSITVDDENAITHKGVEGEWSVKAVVEFYDGLSETIDLMFNVTNEQVDSNELVFKNVALCHDTYKINYAVDLTRYSYDLEYYKEAYDELNNASEGFKEKALEVKDLKESMDLIYTIEYVTQDSVDFYNEFLATYPINIWLSSIVETIEMKDEEMKVVYGSDATFGIVVSYLDGSIGECDIDFDYTLADISESTVSIKSIVPFESKVNEKIVYSEYITAIAIFERYTLNVSVGNNSFEYDGEEHNLSLEFDIVTKFGDSVSNVVVTYLKNGSPIVPKDVGTYSVNLQFDVTNSEYYILPGDLTINLVITPKEVDVVWEGVFSTDYDGENKINMFGAYYYDIDGEKVLVEFDEDSIINAGEYAVSAIIEDNNYIAKENTVSKTFLVEKIPLKISIGEYSITYREEIPNIDLNVEGLLEVDVADIQFVAIKGNTYYNISVVVDCGIYILKPVIINYSDIAINYEVEYVNGSLTIVGIDTLIEADDVVTYTYNNVNFEASKANVVVKEVNGDLIVNPIFKYVFIKDGSEVNMAVDAGEYSVRIIFESTEIYNSSEIEITLNVEKENLTLNINDSRSFYGDSISPLTYSISEGKIYGTDYLGITLSKEEGANVGKYAISGIYEGVNYNVTFINGEYEILPRVLVVLIEDKNSDYLEDLVPLTSLVCEGFIVEGDELNVVLTKELGLVAGEYSITGKYNNSNYDVTFISGIYTINKIDMTNRLFEDVEATYNGNEVSFGVSSVELSDGNLASVKYYVDGVEVESIVNAGTYNVVAILSNENYNSLTLHAQIIVNQGENTLGYDSDSSVYEYDSLGIDYRLENIKFIDGRDASVSYRIFKGEELVYSIIDLGEYDIIATIEDNLGNYPRKTSYKTITVVQKNLIVKYGSDTYTYNGRVVYPTVESSQSYKMSFNTEDGAAPKNVGNYIMTIEAYNDNYKITNNTYNFEIVPLEIQYYNFENKEYEYCACAFINDVSISNLAVGDNVELVFEYSLGGMVVNDMVNVGEYMIKVVDLEGSSSDNYSINDSDTVISLNILPRSITVTPISKVIVYGDEDNKIDYLLSQSLYENDEIQGALGREIGDDVGEYVINMGTLDGGNNYNLVLAETIVYYIINPKPIEFEYDTAIFNYDGEEKRLDVTIIGEAHVEYVGDMVSVGAYHVKIVVDSSNYCLPEGYDDIEVVINKRDVSNSISLINSDYVYDGSVIIPEVSCNGYDCSVRYLQTYEEIESIIFPGVYVVRVLIENETDLGEKDFFIEVEKAKGVAREVSIEKYYNKIVLDRDDSLEYSIDNGDYYSINVFSGLRSKTKYTIRVRSKETNLMYASDPIIYNVSTTGDPKNIHELINKLTDEVNEENLRILKEIKVDLMEVNEKDIDEEKFAYYEKIKRKYESAIDSYDENLLDSNKIFDFMEKKTMMFSIAISMLAILLIIKRRFDVL